MCGHALRAWLDPVPNSKVRILAQGKFALAKSYHSGSRGAGAGVQSSALNVECVGSRFRALSQSPMPLWGLGFRAEG